jgi:hypothetical protein
LGSRGRWISEFKASLDYRVSFRAARAMKRNPISKKKKKKKKNLSAQKTTSHETQSSPVFRLKAPCHNVFKDVTAVYCSVTTVSAIIST